MACGCIAYRRQKFSARTCEGEMFNLECAFSQRILIGGTCYGRTNDYTCNHKYAAPQWNATSCIDIVDDIVKSQCEGRYSCNFVVNNALMGGVNGTDPCPGIYKYLEVHYWCTYIW